MSIRHKLLITLFLTAALPSTILISVNIHHYRKTLIEEKIQSLNAIALLKKRRIENYFSEVKKDISLINSLFATKQFVSTIAGSSGVKKDPRCDMIDKYIYEAIQKAAKDYDLFGILFIDPSGRITNTVPVDNGEFRDGEMVTGRLSKTFVVGKEKLYFSDIFKYPYRENSFAAYVALPCHSPSGDFIGVTVAVLDMEPIYQLIQSTIGLGRTGETLLVKRYDNDILWLNTLRHRADAALNLRRPIGSPDALPAQEAAAGRTGNGFSIDYRGKKVLASWLPISNLGWGLVAKIDEEEALAVIYEQIIFDVFLGFFSLLIVFGVAVFLTNSFTKPIMQLVAVAKRVGKGDLTDVPVLTTQDEIGRFSAILAETVKSLRLITVSRDELVKEVEQRTRVETALRDSEQRIRFALESAKGGAWDWNLKTGEAWWSIEMYALWGIEPGTKMLLENSLTRVHARDRERLRDTVSDAIVRCGNYQCEFRIMHPQKGERWMMSLGHIVCDENNCPIRMPGITIDITDRKLAELALSQSQKDLAHAQEVGQMGSWRLDCRTNVLTWSDETYRIFGVPQKRALTFDLFMEVVHPDDRDYVDAQWKACMRGEPYDIEHRIIVEGNVIKWVREKAYLELDEKGGLISGFGITQDITERKKYEESLRKINEALERSNKELENFAYIASHDLQEPLRMIASYTQLVEKRHKPNFDEETTQFFNFIVAGTKRMQTLINDLLLYSRVGTNVKPFGRVDMNRVLENVKTNLKIRIEQEGAVIRSPEMPEIWADNTLMEQLMQNLIGNAIKFHRAGVKPEIDIKVEEHPGWWRFSVADNGIGIDEKYFEKVFIIFSRLQSREKYEGTGLGLSLCKKIVQLHGGKIGIESQIGKGSIFYFTIPKKGKLNAESDRYTPDRG